MTLNEPRDVNDIRRIYRNNHGYIPLSTLRYHLSTRKLDFSGHPISIFELRDKKYVVSTEGKELHKIFDEFLNTYERGVEERIKDIWKRPIKELIDMVSPIVYLRDRFHKVIRILRTTDFVLAYSSEIEGIISHKEVMEAFSKNINKQDFLDTLSVKDVMKPISGDQIVDGKLTLMDIIGPKEGIRYTRYVVELDPGIYGVLNVHDIIRELAEI